MGSALEQPTLAMANREMGKTSRRLLGEAILAIMEAMVFCPVCRNRSGRDAAAPELERIKSAGFSA